MADLVRGIELPQEEQQRREMRVREAGPFLQLMNLPLSGDDDDDNNNNIEIRRVLPNREVLKKIADACDLVLLLQDPLLPSVRRLPTDATHLLMMDACANKLEEYARAVGGSFNVSCSEFAQRINSYTADARGHPGYSTDDSLRNSIDDLLCQASRFLDMTYTPDEAEA